MKIALVVLACACAWAVVSSAAEPTPPPQTTAELRSEIEKILQETRTPGGAVAIVSREKTEWVDGIGMADLATGRAATAKTLFRIGSTSKGFAALAALKLAEEGRLQLTDTVRQWVPEVAFENPWEATDPVRLVHLMEHTAGFDDIHMREYAHNDPTPVTLRDALAFGASSRVSRWRPGSRMAYCNSGPAVLAAVIEKVTGQRFEEYVNENFFAPLGMKTASYFLTPQVQQALTTTYRRDGSGTVPYWHVIYRPAGSINASAEDMAPYVRFLLGRGTLDGVALLRTASIERMEKPQTLQAAQLGDLYGYGLYNSTRCIRGHVFQGHRGGLSGGLTEMAYSHELGCGYVVMINAARGDALWRIAQKIQDYILRDAPAPSLPAPRVVPAELRRQFSGFYRMISPLQQAAYSSERLRVKRVQFDEQGLWIGGFDGKARERWLATRDRLFRKETDPIATLALLPDGADGTHIQVAEETLLKVSAVSVFGPMAVLLSVYALAACTLLFAPIWGVRKLLGRLRTPGPLAVRIVPLLATVLLLVWLGLAVACAAREDLYSVLGTPGTASVLLFLSGLGFALVSCWGVLVAWRCRRAPMNRITYWLSALTSGGLAIVAGYLVYWGAIGRPTWW